MTENEISKVVLDTSIKLQKTLGRGLLENAYELCLAYDLEQQGMKVEQQVPISIRYKELVIESAYRADIVVEDKVIIELKTVAKFEDVHYAQLSTYLKLSGRKLGLLINFNAPKIIDGFARIANGMD